MCVCVPRYTAVSGQNKSSSKGYRLRPSNFGLWIFSKHLYWQRDVGVGPHLSGYTFRPVCSGLKFRPVQSYQRYVCPASLQKGVQLAKSSIPQHQLLSKIVLLCGWKFGDRRG